MYEIIVVGKGLFGSSAVRYLSEKVDGVAVVGPDEPVETAVHRGVFGAHYDEGRLTYQLKADPVWAELARASLARFPAIESASGIQFHSPVGNLYLASEKMDHGRFDAGQPVGLDQARINFEKLDSHGIKERFPYLKAAQDCLGLWEAPPAGYFSPRRFIQAQLALSSRAVLVNEVVTGIAVEADGVSVNTAAAGQFRAKKVLVSAGAYTNNFGLLPRPLSLKLKREYVIRAALPEEEVTRLSGMVPVIYQIDHPRLADLYILPPVKYPDGRYYLKMGANTALDGFVETADEISDWYRNGDSDAMLDEMRALLLEIFPGLKADGWRTHRCVITRTGHGRPYIDMVVPDRVYVAVGGNGQGAKAADEVGRLAAELLLEGQAPGEAFSAVFQ